jgi:hypothetical protein
VTHAHTKADNLRFALRVAGLLAKGFAAIVTLLLIVAAAAYFAIPRLVDAQRVRTYLETGLQQALARPVRIENVIVTPHGIKLTQIKILEPGGGASFIESDFALVTIRLRALLDRRIELSNVQLAAPRIRVSREESGRWSFEDLFTSTTTARAFVLPVSLAADQMGIENGRLEVDDRARGRHFMIDRFNLSLRHFDIETPFAFSLSFDNVNALGNLKITGSLSLEGEANLAGLDWAQATVRASNAELKLDGRSVTGTFSAKGLRLPSIEATLKLPTVGALDLERWLQRPVDVAFPASRCKARVQMLEATRLRVDELAFESGAASATVTGVVDWATGAPIVSAEASLSSFPLDQAASLKPTLERLGLKGSAAAEVSLTGTPGRWVIGRAHLRLRDAEARFAHWRVVKGDADLTATDDFARLALTLSNGAVTAFGNDFRDITLALKLARKDLQVDYASAKWESSRLRLRGRVVNLPDPKDVWITGTLDELQWERAQKLITDFAASISTRPAVSGPATDTEPRRLWVQTIKSFIPRRVPDTIGRIRVAKVAHKNFSFQETELFWDLHGVTPNLDTVSGEVRVAFGPGRVNDIQAVSDSHKFLKIVFLPYIYMHKMNKLSVLSPATAYPTTLDFNRIEGQYGIRKGVVTTRFSSVDSPQLLAYADGTADFGRESVDMNILTRLARYSAPLPEWWVDERGRPAIGFRVMGDLNRPELEPRLHKIGANEIETTMLDGRRRAKERFEAMTKLEQLEAANDIKGAKK